MGFDALTFDYLDEFDLPNFERLRHGGIEAPLRSTFPPWTASAWPSMYTGVEPGHHGVFDFFQYGTAYPDDATIVSRNDVRAAAVWNYLSALDVPSIVLNMPVTYPADRIDGVLIPGYLAPEEAPGYPERIRDDLADRLGGYRIYSRGELSDDENEKLDGYVELIEVRRRAAKYLLASYDWQFAAIQVQKTDAVVHNFEDRQAIQRVYETADELVGTVLDLVGENANVIVCSDHGIGRATGYQLYVNEVLRGHGFVETTVDSEGPSMRNEKQQLMGNPSEAETSPSLPAHAVSAVARLLDHTSVTPGRVYRHAEQLGIDSALTKLLPAGTSVLPEIDWQASHAYCRSSSELGIRINLEGREPDGVVSRSEYEPLRSRIVEILSELRTPDGQPAFDFVVPREDVYDGPHAADACDVLFLPKDMNNVVRTGLPGKRVLPVDTATHKPEGAFIAAGPGFDRSADIEGFELLGIAPTIMALLGCAVPSRMTGTVPDGLLNVPVSYGEYSDVEFNTGRADADAGSNGRVKERLEDLGYI